MSSYEDAIVKVLKKGGIFFQREKTFQDLANGKFRFDFFIPNFKKQKILLEVDGEQHFKPIYGRATFLKGQEHDRRKNSYCLANDLPLYRIPYWEVKNIFSIQDIMQSKFLVTSRWHNDNLEPL